MSPNGIGMRGFGCPNKGFAIAKARAPKIWVKAGVGASPRGDRPSQPEPWSRRRAAKRIPFVKRS